MHDSRVWLAAALLLAAPATTTAQDATALVAEALANNPDVRAAEAAVAAARQQPAQAGALPDPSLATVFTNEGWTPRLGGEAMDSNLAVMVSQAFPARGTRALQGRIAARDVAVAEQQLARVRRSVEAAVRRTYASLAQSRALLALVDEQAETWRQIEEVARARYAVGQGAQQDVLRVQVELTRVEEVRVARHADEELRLAELNRLLGADGTRVIPTTPPAPPAAVETLDAAFARLRVDSPELRAAEVAVERARLAVDLAKAQFRPSFSVQGAYMNRGGLDPMWQAGIGVALPVRKGWRQAALAEAEARVRAAEAQQRATELELRLRTQERLVQLATARSLRTLYAEGVVPQGQMAVEAAIANYQAGKVPFLAVLEALATLYGDRATQIGLDAGAARAAAALEEAGLAPTSDVAPPAGSSMTTGLGTAFGAAPMAGSAPGAAPASSGGAMAPMGGR